MMNVIVNPEVYGRYRPTNRSTHTLAVELSRCYPFPYDLSLATW